MCYLQPFFVFLHRWERPSSPTVDKSTSINNKLLIYLYLYSISPVSRADINGDPDNRVTRTQSKMSEERVAPCYNSQEMFEEINRPFPSSPGPLFQNDVRCSTFLVEMSFICMRMKNHFHIKGWAPNLVLIQRPGGTQKWPIPWQRSFKCRWKLLKVRLSLRRMIKMELKEYCED